MSEMKMIRLVSANGGIPPSFKSFKTINVQSSERQKVIRVALPQNVIIGRSSQPTIPDKSTSGDDLDGAPLSKNAQLARENRQKKKQYITGLEENLSKAQQQNETLSKQLIERDNTIDKLRKEITYFKSILANVKEISSLVSTIKQDSTIPLSSSLRASKRSFSLSNSDSLNYKKMKMDRCSESSGDCSSLHEDSDQFSINDWMPMSPFEPSPLNTEFFDTLSNFSEEEMNLFPEVNVPENFNGLPKAGVCLHVFNKKISLEFCPTCSTMAQENWEAELNSIFGKNGKTTLRLPSISHGFKRRTTIGSYKVIFQDGRLFSHIFF